MGIPESRANGIGDSRRRPPSTDTHGQPFAAETIEMVWQKGLQVIGQLPEFRKHFRLNVCGKLIARADYGRATSLGWEIDHIKPVVAGGTDDLANLQPLYWRTNRSKGDAHPWEHTEGVRRQQTEKLEPSLDRGKIP